MNNDENYLKILERISRSSGLDKDEIDRKVEAKRAKLSGLISREGAAQIIAAELNINFDTERLKLNELLPGMKKANTLGKVIQVFPVRTYERQGKENKVVNFIIADETTNVKVVLWDTNHIEMIEKKNIEIGTVIEISNGSVREGELHLGSFSDLKISNEVFEKVKTEISSTEKKINQFTAGANVKVRAFIVQVFPPKIFDSKQKPGEKGVLMNIVLDDGSETIRSVLFNDVINKLGIGDDGFDDPTAITQYQKELLGKEMIFSGTVRKNTYFNTIEFNINSIEDIDLDKLINELER